MEQVINNVNHIYYKNGIRGNLSNVMNTFCLYLCNFMFLIIYSLIKVLFIFPSRYFCTIGLQSIFRSTSNSSQNPAILPNNRNQINKRQKLSITDYHCLWFNNLKKLSSLRFRKFCCLDSLDNDIKSISQKLIITLFARCYWVYQCSFQFLHLIICLNLVSNFLRINHFFVSTLRKS